MPKQNDEKTADEMAKVPLDQSVETPDEIPEPAPRRTHPDAPILKPDAVKGKVIIVIDGLVYQDTKYVSPGEAARPRAVVVFRAERDILYHNFEGDDLTLKAGEVGKFFTSSQRVVYAIEHWTKEKEPFSTAKRVKVTVDPQSRGKGIKFVIP